MEQARFEANAERNKKLERDYHASVDTIDTPNFFKAHAGPEIRGGDLSGLLPAQARWHSLHRHGPRGCSPVRASRSSGYRTSSRPWLRSSTRIPGSSSTASSTNHELHDDFNQIASIVRKQNPSDEQVRLSNKLIEYQHLRSALVSVWLRHPLHRAPQDPVRISSQGDHGGDPSRHLAGHPRSALREVPGQSLRGADGASGSTL